MKLKPAKNRSVLLKRLRRFFENVPDERRPAISFVNDLCKVADVLVFGGLVRDLALHGGLKFHSDLDLVVIVLDRPAFDKFLSSHTVHKNKFGGFRIKKSRWIFDLWELDKTWAFHQKLVEHSGKTSLLKTTFFNWDAIFYEVKERRLVHEKNYFKNLCQKQLDIILEENPNSSGAFIRALRLIVRDRAQTSKKLSAFLIDKLKDVTDEEILSYEAQRFSRPLLEEAALRKLRLQAERISNEDFFEWLPHEQNELFD